MKVFKLTERDTRPVHYINAWEQFHRMGDLACLVAVLTYCRATNPDSTIKVFQKPSHPKCHYGRQIPMDWYLKDLVDQLILLDSNEQSSDLLPKESVKLGFRPPIS